MRSQDNWFLVGFFCLFVFVLLARGVGGSETGGKRLLLLLPATSIWIFFLIL